jgi:outer membrane protein assembly factor BamB
MRVKNLFLLFGLILFTGIYFLTPGTLASDPNSGDWPMWGGTPDRNMISNMKGLPTSWDVKTKKNVKWVAQLGSQTYGNVVVAGGIVFVGTNNEGLRDPKITGDKGILMAFKESDGQFLWQMVHDKLAAGRVNDWPYQGVASSPLVEGDRVYYVSNRAELVCLDAQGFRDKENDGPVTDEKLNGEANADVVWSYDMIEEVGALPHNLANSSPVSHGDLIFVSTSNGQDESHVNVPSPKSPSIIAVNKKTGKLVWEDNSVGEKILHGQWSSPTVGTIGGVVQVVHGQGDGWVRGYEAATGKKLWEFDTNPKDSTWPKTRNEIISTPVIYQDRVYLSNGQDPEHGEAWATCTASTAANAEISRPAASSGTTTRFVALFPRPRSKTASFIKPTSAVSCTHSMRRRVSPSGYTMCSPQSGDRPCSSTARSILATKMATS